MMSGLGVGMRGGGGGGGYDYLLYVHIPAIYCNTMPVQEKFRGTPSCHLQSNIVISSMEPLSGSLCDLWSKIVP